MIQIAAAILQNNKGQLLIGRRGPGGSCAFLWEFPGGKQEPGETLEACAKRECWEELGVTVLIGGLYMQQTYSYPERLVTLSFFTGVIAHGTPRATVHDALRWVDLWELQRYAFCPANAALIARLTAERPWTGL